MQFTESFAGYHRSALRIAPLLAMNPRVVATQMAAPAMKVMGVPTIAATKPDWPSRGSGRLRPAAQQEHRGNRYQKPRRQDQDAETEGIDKNRERHPESLVAQVVHRQHQGNAEAGAENG